MNVDYINQLGANKILGVSILACLLAQIAKVIIDVFTYRTITFRLITSTGGMPSSHTAFVSALSTSVGLKEGFNSTLFALSCVFSLITMYDAAGVRRAAGKQAEVLNILLERFETSGIRVDKKLKELLGHSPIEVLGGLFFGITVAIICYSV